MAMRTIDPRTAADMSPDDFAVRFAHALSHGTTLGELRGLEEHDYETLYAVGQQMYAQARYADALKVFGLLATFNHMEERFYSAYAACLQMLKNYEEAIVNYSMASVFDMSDPKPTFHTCECLIALGRVQEAYEGLGMVIEQCVAPDHGPLKARSEALRELIEQQVDAVKGGAS